jgi:hypothetical protein
MPVYGREKEEGELGIAWNSWMWCSTSTWNGGGGEVKRVGREMSRPSTDGIECEARHARGSKKRVRCSALLEHRSKTVLGMALAESFPSFC